MTEPPTYQPPANPEAEQSVLGAILVRPETLDQVADIIAPKDFYRTSNGLIFQAMLDLYNKSDPVDLVTVCALLKERGRLDAVGGPVFLAELSQQVGFAVNAQHYANIIHEKAILRSLLDASQQIAAACLQPQENVPEFLDTCEQRVFEIAEVRIRTGFKTMGELAVAEYALLESIYQKGVSITGVTSGFSDLDKLTAGWQNSDLIILAARPSMGKTALALNFAFNAATAKTPTPVAFFSLEMSKEQLVRRQLSSTGRVDANNLRRAFLVGEEWARLNAAVTLLLDCPIYIDDTPAATVMDIRSKSRRLKAEGKLGMIIVDYLQLMRGMRGNKQNREQEISEISRNLKMLAKELNVPVIALAQLSRECEKRENRRPLLSDLRESGAIEQDADVVMFIYRDELYVKESKDAGTAEVIVSKQRNGPTGMLKLAFQGRYTHFDNLAKEVVPGYQPELS